MKYTKMAILGAALFCLSVTAGAQTGDSDKDIKYRDDINSVKMFKKVDKDQNNPQQYLITLESFVTGSKEISEMEVRKPVDMVLLMDLSGSMAYSIGGNDYYLVPTTMELSYGQTTYQAYNSKSGNPLQYFALNNSGVNTPLYYKFTDGKYYAISRGRWTSNDHKSKIVDEDGNTLTGYIEYLYFTPDGSSVKNPVGSTSAPQRYFLGFNKETGKYDVLPSPAYTTAPLKLKEGRPEGSSNLEDYYAVSGYYATESSEVLFRSNELYSQSRMGALREAVNLFIDTVKKDDDEHLSDDDGHHRIGLAKFSNNYISDVGNTFTPGWANISQPLMLLSSVATSVADAKSKMDELIPSGTTYTNNGMQAAQHIFENAEDDGKDREKTLVVFTDGEPDNFTTYANGAIGYAKSLKEAGVKIYVVGLIEKPSDQGLWFMEYLSSDYPDAESMTNGGTKQFDKYYSQATTGEQLKNIFSTIASNEARTEVGYDLKKTGQVVLDALTDHFMLPEGADVRNIGVYTRDYLGLENGVYTFKDDLVPLSGAKVSLDGREIVVSGFDFAENWCGIIRQLHLLTDPTVTPHGKELVITIPIIVDPVNPGGVNNPTNEAYSGIYLDDGTGKPDMSKPLREFPIPSLAMPNIVIKKDGLQGNDCAVFKIIKVDENGDPETGTLPFTVMLTAANKGKATVKLLTEGLYKVVEDNWSWSYSVTPSSSYTKDDGQTKVGSNYVIRHVGESTEDATEKGTVFLFTNTMRTDSKVPAHGEDAVNNIFFTPQVIVH